MEGFDELAVDFDVADVVEALEDEMGRVVEDVDAWVIARGLAEALEGDAVMKIFAGMDFEGEINAVFFRGVEDGEPAFSELGEAGFDKAFGALWPGIHSGPEESAAEGGDGGEAEVGGGFDYFLHLADGPLGAGFGVAADGGSGECIEEGIVRGMHRNKLTLEVCGELGDGEAVAAAFQLVAVSFRGSRLIEVNAA